MMVDWHPRQNAYPVMWALRNGARSEPYALLRTVTVRESGRDVIRYELTDPYGAPLGSFPTGDAAAEYAWEWMLQKSHERHRAAATRQHERSPGKANTPARTER